jgi:hypothetical protein
MNIASLFIAFGKVDKLIPILLQDRQAQKKNSKGIFIKRGTLNSFAEHLTNRRNLW